MPAPTVLRSCQPASASLPACIASIIKSPEPPLSIPGELEQQFSRFSFSSPSKRRAVPPLSPLSSARSSLTNSRTRSRNGTDIGTRTFLDPANNDDIPRLTIDNIPPLSIDGIPNLTVDDDDDDDDDDDNNNNNNKKNDNDDDDEDNEENNNDNSEVILSRRRSSQEETHMELDHITDDLRRIQDGMKNTLNRYISKFTLYFSNHFRRTWPWPRLKSSLKSLRHKITTLLSLIIQGKFSDVQCEAIKARLKPSITTILAEGFSILALWNERDKSLTIKKIVHFERKERKRMILASSSRLNLLVARICECEKLVQSLLVSFASNMVCENS